MCALHGKPSSAKVHMKNITRKQEIHFYYYIALIGKISMKSTNTKGREGRQKHRKA